MFFNSRPNSDVFQSYLYKFVMPLLISFFLSLPFHSLHQKLGHCIDKTTRHIARRGSTQKSNDNFEKKPIQQIIRFSNAGVRGQRHETR